METQMNISEQYSQRNYISQPQRAYQDKPQINTSLSFYCDTSHLCLKNTGGNKNTEGNEAR